MLKEIDEKRQNRVKKQALATLIFMLFWVPHSGSTETVKKSLPPPPDTGSPEEDFSAGGTRDSHLTKVCGVNGQSLAYLLGNKNRELTLSAYPTFWFYISNNAKQITQIKFVLAELETNKKIYERTVRVPKSGAMGIALPHQQQYSLSANVNYSWSLEVDCAESKGEPAIALEGWLYRVASTPDLQNQLAAFQSEKYQVYLQHNLLYDALNDLAQRRLAEPNNPRLAIAWQQLLIELGWQDLTQQSAVEPYLLEAEISNKN